MTEANATVPATSGGQTPESDRGPTEPSSNHAKRLSTEAGLPAPNRVQLSRAKGWRMPADTVKVDRSTRWGNPWTAGAPGRVRLWGAKGWLQMPLPMALTLEGCLDRHRRWLRGEFTTPAGEIRMDHPLYDAVICDPPPARDEIVQVLRGLNLACWCKLPRPGEPDLCHAAVLLELANAPLGNVSPSSLAASRAAPGESVTSDVRSPSLTPDGEAQ